MKIENDKIILTSRNKNVNPTIYIPRELHAPFLTITDKNNPETSIISQIENITNLPNILSVTGFPDIHHGYCFPIGTVSVFDLTDSTPVIPEGVGYDIGCGVRGLTTSLTLSDIKDKQNELADLLFQEIPINTTQSPFDLHELNQILEKGVKYLVENQIVDEDLSCIENQGAYPGNSRLISQKSKSRGLTQLGTLGSGNHYLEIQYVDEIYNEEDCKTIGITKKEQIVIMIHCGSRGLGHQICTDFINKMKKKEEKDEDKNKDADRDNKNDKDDNNDKDGYMSIINTLSSSKDLQNINTNLISPSSYDRTNNSYKTSTTTNNTNNNTTNNNNHCSDISLSPKNNISNNLLSNQAISPNHTLLSSGRENIKNNKFIYDTYDSEVSKDYIMAMGSAINYAMANRSYITMKVKKCLNKLFKDNNRDMDRDSKNNRDSKDINRDSKDNNRDSKDNNRDIKDNNLAGDIEVSLIYDGSHNSCRIEKYNFEGVCKEVLVYRKGVSYGLERGNKNLSEKYVSVGQPIMVGGSMGTYSYIVSIGDNNVFNSCCHGSGRLLSRREGVRSFTVEEIQEEMKSKNIVFRCGKIDAIGEEASGCYKDVVGVVEYSDRMGLTKRLCRLKPLIVIKG